MVAVPRRQEDGLGGLGASAVGIFASSTRLPLVFATQPLDFSQWLLVTREEVPEELVNLVTSVIVEDREVFESRYRQQPVK